MNIETFIARALELRSAADEAEREFLEFLYEGEHTDGLWQASGLTFGEFIERNNLCKAITYARFKRIRDGLPEAMTTGVGTNALIAAGAFSDPTAQREVLDEAKKWEQTNAVSISRQSAERISRDVKVRHAAARSNHRGYSEIVAENERLREEVQRLREENVALRAELRTKKGKKQQLSPVV